MNLPSGNTKQKMKTNYEKLLPFWLKRLKLQVEGDKLYAESNKLYAEGAELYAEGYKLYAEGDKLWKEAVSKIYGNSKMQWENDNCILSDGIEFNRHGIEETLLYLNWDKI